MTDIKEYENLTATQQLNLFRNMYYNDGNATEKGIIANAINGILLEYNRQKEEMDRLQEHNNILICRIDDLVYECDCAKQEAIKEVAEMIKNKQYAILRANCNLYVICECADCIDSIVKELMEKQR